MTTKIHQILKLYKEGKTKQEIIKIMKVSYDYISHVLSYSKECRCGNYCIGSECSECKSKSNYGISYNRNSSEYSLRKGITKSTTFSL